jgi:hypothetical protein
MQTLSDFTFKSFANENKARYPWAEILDGQIHQLDEGTDYQCKPQTLIMMARNKAKKANPPMTIRANKANEGKSIVIQAVRANGKATPASQVEDPKPEPKAKKSKKAAK